MPIGHPRFRELSQEEVELHDAKNFDYAQGGDPLGNFKRVANILRQYPGIDLGDPTVVALFNMLKQLDAAFWMLCQHREGRVETIGTRLTDISVYAKLARIIHEERVADDIGFHGEQLLPERKE